MVSRDEDQGSAAITGIKKDFGSDTVVEWIHCDLGNLHEIKDVFTTIREKEDRLDLVSSHAVLHRRAVFSDLATARLVSRNQCEQV